MIFSLDRKKHSFKDEHDPKRPIASSISNEIVLKKKSFYHVAYGTRYGLNLNDL